MASRKELRDELDSTRDVQSVVQTMKALAAANLRQYRRASEALTSDLEVVELAFRAALRDRERVADTEPAAADASVAAVIVGSDQGMCGGFNERVAEHARATLAPLREAGAEIRATLIGHRLVRPLELPSEQISDVLDVPLSPEGIGRRVQDLAVRLQEQRARGHAERLLLLHQVLGSGLSSKAVTVQLYPLDPRWLRELQQSEWESPRRPTHRLPWPELFAGIVQHYLFIMIHRSIAESIAAENANRLRAMQAAERNVEERIESLRSAWQRERQNEITRELLDVIAGYEALEGD